MTTRLSSAAAGGTPTAPAPSQGVTLQVHDYDFDDWPQRLKDLWKPLSKCSKEDDYQHLLGLFIAFERWLDFTHWDVRIKNYSFCSIN
jgi:hypothetical protein